MRSLFVNLSIALISFSVGLIIIELVFQSLPTSSSTNMLKDSNRDRLTHFQPNRIISFSSDWDFSFNIRHRSNNYGFINRQDYNTSPQLPVLAVIGDSYVEAFQVPYAESFHGHLSQHLDDQYAVYTFASSDAPLSQYLKWAQFAREEFTPQHYIFTIISNDFHESDVYYGVKPLMNQFQLVQDRYEFVPIDYEPGPLKTIARESALIRYLVLNLRLNSLKILHNAIANLYSTTPRTIYTANLPLSFDTEQLRRSKLITETFLTNLPLTCGKDTQDILFVVDADRQHIYGEINDTTYTQSYFYFIRGYFIKRALEEGFSVIDLDPIFRSDFAQNKKRFEFANDSHWNSYAHQQIYAKVIEHRFVSD